MHRRRLPALLCVAVALARGAVAETPGTDPRARPSFEFTRMIAHWDGYGDPRYLEFIDAAKPELVQVGFYGAHFWSLADTPWGSGYPAHFPVRGHAECTEWFRRLNAAVHERGAKVVGHFNVKFLVGDPDGPDGPRGFFRFWREQWDESRLGRRPVDDPVELLERDRRGVPISSQSYAIGGMREYWACLSNPAWRETLKTWVRVGIEQGVDGFIANYLYRHDCHCSHCVAAFRRYLAERFTPDELEERFSIADVDTFEFEEIGAWHDPATSTPLRREALRFSQISNQDAFDEVFVRYGRSLEPDLIVAQWNHLGNFSQISGDERCLLPSERWARDEDYLWYSTGDAANASDLARGILGEGTLQARYIRGASGGKPFTLGKYEGVRIRSAIAELAANGGAPMGFYTRFTDEDARREIVRYYAFLRRHDELFRANVSHAEALLIFPRSRVHDGDVASVERFQRMGRRLLDDHVLFDVLPDDKVTSEVRRRYAAVIEPAKPIVAASGIEDSIPSVEPGVDVPSRFDAPATVRVSADRPRSGEDLIVHFVNYDRSEPADGTGRGSGIADEKPRPTPEFEAVIRLPEGFGVRRAEFLTPESDLARELGYRVDDSRVVLRVPSFLVYGLVRLGLEPEAAADRAARRAPRRLEHRVPWTSSRLVGSPDPPLPYTVERTFERVRWRSPLYAVAEPATMSLLIVEQGGEPNRPSRVLRIEDDPGADKTSTILELGGRLIYSVTFHPRYAENGALFVFTNGPTGDDARANKISRFFVSREGDRACDPASETVIIEWASSGHDGGDLAFGGDEKLYIASGDGTSDSDLLVTGQDLSDLRGGVLRIDVDRPEGDRAYSIPPDNPFVGLEGARGEIWAFGLRNPWRMSIDRATDRVWVGNNGQDLWETVHLVRRGDNFGWSVYEGNHPFYLGRSLGPAPFVPPTIEHHHREARSLTGGVVVRVPGAALPGSALARPELARSERSRDDSNGPTLDLEGTYVYGDYETGKIWGARHDGTRIESHRELADTTLQITAFCVSPRGDLLVVDHGGSIHRIVSSKARDVSEEFPRRLSETGLFTAVADHVVADGVLPYGVRASAWMDGASAERFLALPGASRIDFSESRAWGLPDGAVLMQTLSIDAIRAETGETESGSTARQRIETRLLVRQQGEWAGYSYRWNRDGSDALLVGADGEDGELPPSEAGENDPRVWRFPSRAECMSCHSRAVGYLLGVSTPQLQRDWDHDDTDEGQIRILDRLGYFSGPIPASIEGSARLVDPYDESAPIESRARSYLHVNCSPCHVEAGGGNSRMELELTRPIESMRLISARPQHDPLGLENAMLVAPGDPERSVLLRRVNRRGSGQMPPLVSRVVDTRASAVLRRWIAEMTPTRAFVRDWKLEDLMPRLADLESGRSFDRGESAFSELGCGQCHRFQSSGGGVGPDLDGIGTRSSAAELLESIIDPSRKVAPDYATTVIVTTSGRVVEGRIESEDETVVRVRTADLFAHPVEVRKAEIALRTPSESSAMPDGIVDTLEVDGILDLMVYLRSGGRRDDPAFR
jgi:uncharacterized repeat protein (TIGR03806 family)